MTTFKRDGGHLSSYPPVEKWEDWVEYDPSVWPQKKGLHYQLIPTICFNCESACGLLAYIDKETGQVAKFEGNPMHPASRGRVCAKGPAVINQINDPDRLLYPLRRVGPRGSGQWVRVSWEEVLGTFGQRIRRAIQEKRGEEVMYHVGRPGYDYIMERTLQAWGIDGHNSHTNICSSSARTGYVLWHHADRPSPDHANARFILLMSSHLETGHYFNPHAQRIIDGKMAGARLAVMDPRLSNTASMADYWLPTYPGTETAVLLAMVKVILDEERFDAFFMKNWTNWEAVDIPGFNTDGKDFDALIMALRAHYARYTPEFAARESRIDARTIVQVAREIADAGSRFSSHLWRGSASGNLGGWQSARALMLLHVLTGSVASKGGHNLNVWNKFVPATFKTPPPQKQWNELLYPPEWPLAHHELSFLLPHFLKEGRGRVDVYVTRVFNPVWTYPDGFSWIEVLRDEKYVGLHAALTPSWSETAWYADYVLPVGYSSERHDLMSQETHASRWIGFRQPVLRVFQEKQGKKVDYTYQANPGEVWEEDEFWINLSWAIDPDGSMGIRQWFESPYRPGQKITVDEYYGWIFENAVPGLPQAAAKEALSPLAYMRKYGAFEVTTDVYQLHERTIPEKDCAGATIAENGVIAKEGKTIGVLVDGRAVNGFNTPSRKLELFSQTLSDWKWPEFALPEYIHSHIHRSCQEASSGKTSDQIDHRYLPTVKWPDHARGKVYTLLPIFRLPTLIHTRSGNGKYLYEISHKNPLWVNPVDAEKLGGIKTGDLLKVHTEIGYFVLHAWVTQGLAPGVVACSHHLGRWRVNQEDQIERSSSAWVELKELGPGQWKMRQIEGVRPYQSSDPDTSRVWWNDAGVHQDIAFPVHPDPVSGMHCWHQMVRVERAGHDDRYGDIFVDTNRSMDVYMKWKALCRPAPGPGGLRRPLWLPRSVRPAPEAYYFTQKKGVGSGK
ncbi:MAG TPA: molybdopterin-dependent oxidoreductase [Thermodesulfobacteriota bacterium]|nr:molybdopterin-dependent oxidoreductase [Deltaproteobacteria bacterium]HNR13102.1 molybdopterin-dependent oxidoreductase [Thermodesulfobacteriota bacterium]HNU71077.1 molybdopterin-dependent oxidoreductase [Thermodesulfobacteriota bacterium]